MKNIFSFFSYKAFLEHIEASRKPFEKGFRSKLAESMGCQSGYVSQVLNGSSDFSLEQALSISAYLKLEEKEEKYFLLLIEYARAGNQRLKKFFQKELNEMREAYLNIKQHVGASTVLSEADQSVYYSNWNYTAVHVIASLPDYNSVNEISAALKLSVPTVKKILVFLIQKGILIENNGKLKSGLTQIHLNRESPHIQQHHTNWRIAAIQSLNSDNKKDLHYSTISTLSKEDAEKIKSEFLKTIENYVQTIKPSKEEVMYGFNLDFYNLIND